MDLQHFTPVLLVLFGIAPFFVFDFLFKKRNVPPKVIFFCIKKLSDNPFYGDETEISLYDADIGEINNYSFEDPEDHTNYKKISKYLGALQMKHDKVILVTCDKLDMHLDLVFKYTLNKYMSFDYDDYIFMNLKTMCYFAFMNIDYVSFDDIFPFGEDTDNLPPVLKYEKFFRSLCKDIGFDPTNVDDMLTLRETI